MVNGNTYCNFWFFLINTNTLIPKMLQTSGIRVYIQNNKSELRIMKVLIENQALQGLPSADEAFELSSAAKSRIIVSKIREATRNGEVQIWVKQSQIDDLIIDTLEEYGYTVCKHSQVDGNICVSWNVELDSKEFIYDYVKD